MLPRPKFTISVALIAALFVAQFSPRQATAIQPASASQLAADWRAFLNAYVNFYYVSYSQVVLANPNLPQGYQNWLAMWVNAATAGNNAYYNSWIANLNAKLAFVAYYDAWITSLNTFVTAQGNTTLTTAFNSLKTAYNKFRVDYIGSALP